MQIIHVQTDPASNEYDSTFIKMVVMTVDGVRDVASVPSIGLTSVLYDERRTDATDIVQAVCSAGYGAKEWASQDRLVALPTTAA